MSILDDINEERNAALAILDQKLKAANDLRNAGATGMDNTIDELAALEEKIAEQAYIAALDDPTMAQALAALHAATNRMNTVAARMVSATTFITNLVNLRNEANRVVSALKGEG